MSVRIAGLFLSLALVLPGLPACARAQVSVLTPASADPGRLDDAQRREQIATLEARLAEARARVAADVTRLQDQLVDAREALVADLAARDPVYAEEIAAFRREVQDIASTPEGLAALARYNAGDRVEAIALLDGLRQARDTARRAREDVESAAEARRIATLALDARGKGDPAFDTGAVIARYEAVVRLDPLHAPDWQRLAMLYRAAGRAEDAAAAEARAEALSVPEQVRRRP
jgi:tetratricopeptide (TPR) repeat protein